MTEFCRGQLIFGTEARLPAGLEYLCRRQQAGFTDPDRHCRLYLHSQPKHVIQVPASAKESRLPPAMASEHATNPSFASKSKGRSVCLGSRLAYV